MYSQKNGRTVVARTPMGLVACYPPALRDGFAELSLTRDQPALRSLSRLSDYTQSTDGLSRDFSNCPAFQQLAIPVACA